MTLKPENQYWRDVLDGKNPPIHDGVPQCGYYYGSWYKDSGILPIAIWLDDGEMRCLVGWHKDTGAEPVAFQTKLTVLERQWINICQQPIEYDLYASMFAKGPPWPDEAVISKLPTERHLGDNKPPEGVELHKHELREIIESLRAHLKIEEDKWDQTWADKAGNFRTQLLAKKKVIDTERIEKKKPHDDAGAAVQKVYRPMLDEADKWNKLIREGLGKWKKAEDDRERKRLLEQAKEVHEGKRDVSEIEMPKKAKAGGKGTAPGASRATGFSEQRTAKITDYAKALSHYGDDPQIKNLVQALCNREARAGNDEGPGWEVEKKEVAR